MSDISFTASAKSADAPDIEPGLADATFDGVEVKFITGGQFGDGDRYEWQFTVLDDDGAVLYYEGEPVEVTGLTSMSTNVKSKTVPKAVRYLKALLTEDEYADFVAEKGSPKASDLVGRKVQIDIAIADSGWPKVVNVLPARKARRASVRTASPSQDGE